MPSFKSVFAALLLFNYGTPYARHRALLVRASDGPILYLDV
jgi:hypothetical protein